MPVYRLKRRYVTEIEVLVKAESVEDLRLYTEEYEFEPDEYPHEVTSEGWADASYKIEEAGPEVQPVLRLGSDLKLERIT